MVLRARRHPLRRKYRQQRHLLRTARSLGAYVMVAHDSLFEGHWTSLSLTLGGCGLSTGRATSPSWLESPSGRLSRFHPDPASSHVASLVAWFNGGTDSPLSTAVPCDLSDGRPMRCSLLMVVRKHLPLPCLRSPWIRFWWIPAPANCCIVVPRRYWTRRPVAPGRLEAAPAVQSAKSDALSLRRSSRPAVEVRGKTEDRPPFQGSSPQSREFFRPSTNLLRQLARCLPCMVASRFRRRRVV